MIPFYDTTIRQVCSDVGTDPDLVSAVVMTESSGKTHAYRYEPAFFDRYLRGKDEWKGANPERVAASYGLMQVMYTTALEHGLTGDPEQLFRPSVGLFYGCLHLASLLKWSAGNVDQALAAYNGGKGGNAAPPYRNASYVAKVRRHLA